MEPAHARRRSMSSLINEKAHEVHQEQTDLRSNFETKLLKNMHLASSNDLSNSRDPSPSSTDTSEASKRGDKAGFCIEKRNHGDILRPCREVNNGAIEYPQYSSTLTRLHWQESPSNVLIVKKPNAPDVTEVFEQIYKWLKQTKNMNVYVEPSVHQEFAGTCNSLRTWKDEEELGEVQLLIDFVVSLGGDGTLLWVSSLFKQALPPTIPFAGGSLGFMTQFSTDQYQEVLTSVIEGGFSITLRSRLSCDLYRPNSAPESLGLALNEVVIDRGPSSYLTNLDCYADDIFITTVQADGLIIGTPTGSTAYSLSAGGSIVHPSVPAILFTPVCPHSLSFRPLLFPDSVRLRIQVSDDARHSAWVSLDGRDKQELKHGEYILVHMSPWPLPAVNKEGELTDWFNGVIQGLSWNTRVRQKRL
eukprot:GILJ01003197.1.p1 GENE.GILJ01003197.1~~GILJ01003197.1.p1  ORF type:complete len:433 (+),score=43.63 GILJ01003197.1:51-1301(+)